MLGDDTVPITLCSRPSKKPVRTSFKGSTANVRRELRERGGPRRTGGLAENVSWQETEGHVSE